MMYKLWHKLFGWDYIHWSNSADQGISRLHKDALGNPFYWRYYSIGTLDRITDEKQVTWLTCSPSKYLWPKKEAQ